MSRINTNIPAMLAARVVGSQSDALHTALQRLSTGLKINSGKDDPAGLIASQSLMSENRAIGAAIDNANRASTVVATADGALTEVSSLLLDLEDKVDRSANTTGLSDSEIAANQTQVDAILESINRIANTTQFNGRKLIDGSLAYTTTGVDSGDLSSVRISQARLPDGGTRDVVVNVTAAAETGRLIFNAPGLAANVTASIQVAGKFGSDTFTFAASTSIASMATAINQSTEVTGVSATASSNNKLYFNSTDYGRDAFVSVNATAGTFAIEDSAAAAVNKDVGKDAAVTINGVNASVNGLNASVESSSLAGNFVLTSAFGTAVGSSTFTITGGGANFSISPTAGIAGRASLGFDSVAAGSLGDAVNGFLSSLGSGQANDLTSNNLATSQRIVRTAIDQVSTLRGRLGAFQANTLDTTVNSLQVASENVTSAQSAIADADFATETSKMTRAQILLSAAMQSLTLANQSPSQVLQLLR